MFPSNWFFFASFIYLSVYFLFLFRTYEICCSYFFLPDYRFVCISNRSLSLVKSDVSFFQASPYRTDGCRNLGEGLNHRFKALLLLRTKSKWMSTYHSFNISCAPATPSVYGVHIVPNMANR